MKKGRIVKLSIIFLICILLLTGCWNYREINTFAIVLGCAFDKKADGNYEVTVEIMNPVSKGKEAEMISVVIGTEGESLFDAIRNLITWAGKKLYWSHAKAIIISEQIAREGIVPIVDFFHRDNEVRPDILLLVSREKTAKEILLSDTVIEKSVSIQLMNAARAENVVNKYILLELWELMQKLTIEGVNCTTATVNLVDYQGKRVATVNGIAIYKRGKMVGWLNGEDTQIVSWINGKSEKSLIVIKGMEEQETSTLTYEIKDTSIKIEPINTNGTMSIELKAFAQVQLAELNKIYPAYNNKKIMEKLEKDLELYLHNRFLSVVQQVQKDYQADIFGFGIKCRNKFPQIWKKYENNWGEYFANIPIKVNIDVEVVATALMSKPIKVRE